MYKNEVKNSYAKQSYFFVKCNILVINYCLSEMKYRNVTWSKNLLMEDDAIILWL